MAMRILGPIVPNFRMPIQMRHVQEGSIRHEIQQNNGIIHSISTDGTSLADKIVYVTSPKVETLTKLLRKLTYSWFVPERNPFDVAAGSLLNAVAKRQNLPLIDLSSVTGWNYPCMTSSRGIQLWIIGAQFIPAGLEFGKAWAKFTLDTSSYATSYISFNMSQNKVMEYFYHDEVLPSVRSF